MVIEDFTRVGAGANLTATLTLSRDGVAVHQPIDYVNVVNMLLGDVVTTQPVKVIPVTHLIFEFRLAFFTRSRPDTIAVPVSTRQNDVADKAVLKLLDHLVVVGFVSSLQADCDR